MSYPVIAVDGWITRCGKEYEELQAALNGGWLEFVRLTEKLGAFVDEEGMLKNLPVNVPVSIVVGSPICGPAIIIAATPTHEGETRAADENSQDYKALENLAQCWHHVCHKGGVAERTIAVNLPTVNMDATSGLALFEIVSLDDD